MVLAALASLLCLGTVVCCLALAAAGVGDRTAQLTHAVMGVAMAGMFSPWGDPVPKWVGIAVFVVIGAWFVAALLRRVDGAATHLAISAAAMVLMYLMHGAGAHGGHAMPGMPGMQMSDGPGDLLLMPLTLLLAGYFAWHAWRCADRSRERTPSTGTRASARVEPVAHGAMSALMAAMFLGMM